MDKVVDKRLVGHIVFYAALVLFCCIFFFGRQGLGMLFMLKRTNSQLELANNALKIENKRLADLIDQWQHEPFLKELFAREKLQLAYPEDQVYYRA